MTRQSLEGMLTRDRLKEIFYKAFLPLPQPFWRKHFGKKPDIREYLDKAYKIAEEYCKSEEDKVGLVAQMLCDIGRISDSKLSRADYIFSVACSRGKKVIEFLGEDRTRAYLRAVSAAFGSS